MAKRAHAMQLDALPPVAMLKVVEEDAPADGVDFFEPGATEKHFDSPFVVARVFRGRHAAHRMVVSAEGSADPNGRPITLHWAVLRGDAARIRITPRNDARSVVELVVPWHDRRPVAEGSPLESNRVDIGCFANNGACDSPPSFVTFYFPDPEARTYDGAGRILEAAYPLGETRLEVSDWEKLFGLLAEGATSWPARLLKDRFQPAELAALRAAAGEKPALDRAARDAEERKKKADDAKKASKTPETESEAKAAQKALDDARTAQKNLTAKQRDGLPAPIETLVTRRALGELMREPAFFVKRQAEIEAFLASPDGQGRRGALEGGLRRTASLGILRKADAGAYAATLLRNEPTRFEQAMLERLHGEILAGVLYPGIVKAEFKANYVPPELSEPPSWRDVYRYDARGNALGWTRYVPGGDPPVEFTADGLMVLEKDAAGRPTKARTMTYKPEEPKTKPSGPHWRPLLQLPGDEIRHYAYEGAEDRKGKVTKTEKAPP
jgi:hypothetical protein